MAWTDERVQRLKELCADRLSAGDIAAALGGVSRNGVIGKLRRLGLSLYFARGQYIAAQPAADGTIPVRVRRQYAPRGEKPKRPGRIDIVRSLAPEIEPEPFDPGAPPPRSAFACQVLQLNENTCRYPNGDPQDRAGFHFCGRQPLTGLPYCAPHARIAYETSEQARARRQREKIEREAVSL